MSKSNLVQLHDYLDTTDSQYWARTLQDSIISIAKDFFVNTDDYIDIDAFICDPETDNLSAKVFVQTLRVCGDTFFTVKFKTTFDKNPDSSECIHSVSNISIDFHMNGNVYDVTEELRTDFHNAIQCTGISFLLT